jgi:hypothetical protein
MGFKIKKYNVIPYKTEKMPTIFTLLKPEEIGVYIAVNQ